jgi:hypothetical protein
MMQERWLPSGADYRSFLHFLSSAIGPELSFVGSLATFLCPHLGIIIFLPDPVEKLCATP